ncbi:hypothetical protein FRB94_000592 [Tulasnella sp. JGI-2019a]|nr:hypothetical protein FRB93_013724 [Tulasnella sp. JGI-2019a]KAG9006575.1 hypothetical protein FRB94_000592 [Tulasnella sp. JGI-2019a]
MILRLALNHSYIPLTSAQRPVPLPCILYRIPQTLLQPRSSTIRTMFSQSFFATALLLVAGLTSQVNAHSALAPALGVSGTPVRGDVQRPSTAKPCGTINIASTLDSSTAVTAAADGTFTVTATNFNAYVLLLPLVACNGLCMYFYDRGTDGSTFYTAEVDPTAKGTAFVAATVTKNGVKSPTTVGSVPITVQLPAGTTCTGGAAGDLCLASFTSAGGFGNCVVVKQAGAAASTTAAAAATTAATGATGTAATGKHHHHQKAAAQNKRMVRVRRSHI